MTRERWEELKEIFGSALDREPAERAPFVREAAKHDPGLLADLVRLLEENDHESGLLSRPAFSRARPLEVDEGPRFSPESVLARRFRIVRFIARGGMGEVYEAEDLELGERLALKVIRRHIDSDSEVFPHFKREIQLARRVTHPNVCRIFDMAQHEDGGSGATVMLLSMELLEGHTLAEHLRDNGPFSFRDALPLIEEIAAGLQAAHDAGIIHGDLKPGNVMLSSRPDESRPRAVVMDFGVALPVMAESPGHRLSRGGTPGYLAPEQADGEPVTTATDVYSFALLIAAMLGVPRPVRLKPDAERMPRRSAHTLQRCLDREPGRRISRPAEVARLLRESAAPRWNVVTRVAIAGLAVALVGIPAAYFLADGVRTAATSEVLPVALPLTSLPGVEYGPAISPDGREVAFYWGKHGGIEGIYRKDIGSDKLPSRVSGTGTEGFDSSPAWSPDGRDIAFLRRTREHETWLYLVSRSGGPERRIARLAHIDKTTGRGFLFRANNQHLSWAVDGLGIYAPMSDGDDRRGIFRISIISGEARRITNPQEKTDAAPAVSPDGRVLAFVRYSALPQASEGVFRVGLTPEGSAAGTPQPLYEGRSMISGMAWAPSGDDLVVCKGDLVRFVPSATRLWRVPARAARDPSPVEVGYCNTVAVSRPDGAGRAMLVFGSFAKAMSGLWQSKLTALDRSIPFARSTRFDSLPRFSPDGKLVAFISNRSGLREVWVSGRDGIEPRRITENANTIGAPRWSPDGTRIAYFSGERAFEVPVSGGEPVLLPVGESPRDTSRSSDGRWLYYEIGRQIWRARRDGRDRMLLVTAPFAPYFAAESPDGKSVYYSREANPIALCRVPVEGGPEEVVTNGLFSRSFALSKKSIYFISDRDRALYRKPLSGGPATSLGILPGLEGRNPDPFNMLGMTVAPDDSTIIYARAAPQETDLQVVWNFR